MSKSQRVSVEEQSGTGVIIASVSQILALLVGFAIINSAQQGIIISLTMAAVNAGGLIAHGIHTGSISPSGLATYVGTLVSQAIALAVSFTLINSEVAQLVLSITAAVIAIGVQLAVAFHSKKVAA